MENGADGGPGEEGDGAHRVVRADAGERTVLDGRLNVPVRLSGPDVTREVIQLVGETQAAEEDEGGGPGERREGADRAVREDAGEQTVFDRGLNVPVRLSSPEVTREVLRILRESGAREVADHPDRPCHGQA